VDLEPNPAYRAREPWDPRGHWVWVWRAVIVAILAWNLVSSSWASAVVVAALWILVEFWLRRRQRDESR
jgi:hypothetical protein